MRCTKFVHARQARRVDATNPGLFDTSVQGKRHLGILFSIHFCFIGTATKLTIEADFDRQLFISSLWGHFPSLVIEILAAQNFTPNVMFFVYVLAMYIYCLQKYSQEQMQLGCSA